MHGLLRRQRRSIRPTTTPDAASTEKVSDKKAILRTYDSDTYSTHDCLTVVGWHRKALEMCGGQNVRVTETKCRAKGADVCEYVCEWA